MLVVIGDSQVGESDKRSVSITYEYTHDNNLYRLRVYMCNIFCFFMFVLFLFLYFFIDKRTEISKRGLYFFVSKNVLKIYYVIKKSK